MIIGPLKVCEVSDLWCWASERKLYNYNAIQDLVFHKDPISHFHFCLYDFFVITTNFFNPIYQDDAYGLRWHPKVQEVVKTFMTRHKVTNLGVVTTKQASMCVL